MDMYTLLYLKWVVSRIYCTVHETLLSVCGSLDGRGIWGRLGTCVCITEALCRSPETVTALLIGYTPI